MQLFLVLFLSLSEVFQSDFGLLVCCWVLVLLKLRGGKLPICQLLYGFSGLISTCASIYSKSLHGLYLCLRTFSCSSTC